MEGAAGAQGLGLKQGFWRAPGADALQGTQKGRNDGDVSTVAPLLPYSANPAAKPSKGHTYMRDVSSWSYLEASSPVRELVLYRLPPTSRPGTPSWAADIGRRRHARSSVRDQIKGRPRASKVPRLGSGAAHLAAVPPRDDGKCASQVGPWECACGHVHCADHLDGVSAVGVAELG